MGLDRNSRLRRLCLGVIGASIAFVSNASQAAIWNSAYAHAEAAYDGFGQPIVNYGIDSDDTGQVVSLAIASAGVAHSSSETSVSSGAKATYGSLHAFAESRSNDAGVTGFGTAYAASSDIIRTSSTSRLLIHPLLEGSFDWRTDPLRMTVKADFTIGVKITRAGGGVENYATFVTADPTLYGASLPIQHAVGFSDAGVHYAAPPIDITVNPGDAVEMTSSIQVQALLGWTENGPGPDTHRWAMTDAGNTAYTLIDVVSGPGYTADSGHVYEIPAPPALSMMMVVGVAASRRRRLAA